MVHDSLNQRHIEQMQNLMDNGRCGNPMIQQPSMHLQPFVEVYQTRFKKTHVEKNVCAIHVCLH